MKIFLESTIDESTRFEILKDLAGWSQFIRDYEELKVEHSDNTTILIPSEEITSLLLPKGVEEGPLIHFRDKIIRFKYNNHYYQVKFPEKYINSPNKEEESE